MAASVVRRRTAELLTITAQDGWELDAVLYPAERRRGREGRTLPSPRARGATMLDIHARWLPDRLPGVAHFALNMRCHALAYNTDRDDIPVAGGMYERLADGELDVRAGLEFLRSEGFTKIIMSGHSSGGYYAGVYTPPDEDIVGRMFLSPLTDNKVALAWWFTQPGELESAIERAQSLVADGRPDELIPLPSWYWAISARSLIERAAQPGDLWLDCVNQGVSPVLLAWGGTESRDELWGRIFDQIDAPSKVRERFPDSDHWYHGYEDRVTGAVREFVVQTTGVDPLG